MTKVINVLEQLQTIDLDISAIEEERRKINEDIESLAEEAEAIEREVEELTPEVEGFNAKIKDAEERIRSNTERISKDEKRLGGIQNEKEYNALNKEIRAATRAKKQAEEELTNINAKADVKKSVVEEKGSQAREKREEVERLQKVLEEKSAEWDKTLEDKKAKRDAIAKDVKPGILRKYETIKERRSGRGIVRVIDETCQGCFIHIPPQTYIELQRGTEELITCPHCHRILYFENQDETEPA